MKKIVSISFLLFIIIGCNNDTPPPPNDNSLPSGAVIKAQKISKNNTQIVFDVDFVVFQNKNTINTSIPASKFSIEPFISANNSFSFTSNSTIVQDGISTGTYSACFLLDQSGSIASTDPNNYRIEAAKIFCQSLGPGNNMFLSAFASSGVIPYELTLYGQTFTNNGSSYISTLDELKNQIGGGTPLYKSTYSMIDYTRANAPNLNKALVVFTDGEDTDGSKTPADVINRATAQGVKVYMMGLGSASQDELSGIANKTGGAFMFARDARQLISMFGNLGTLLNGTAKYYHSRWTLQAVSTLPASGWFTNSVTVDLGNNVFIYVPFRVDF